MPPRQHDAARLGVHSAAHVVHRLVGELDHVEGLPKYIQLNMSSAIWDLKLMSKQGGV